MQRAPRLLEPPDAPIVEDPNESWGARQRRPSSNGSGGGFIILAGFNTVPPQIYDTPYKRLIRAHLDEALKCYDGKPVVDVRGGAEARIRERARLRADATQFFASDEEYPYSFVWCCLHLDIDPQRWRRLLLRGVHRTQRWRERYYVKMGYTPKQARRPTF